MLLELSTTAPLASELGFMLHKNPASVFQKTLPYGNVHVFYPEAGDDRCTVALWLDIDPVGLVRRAGDQSFALSQYVNDRPYVASSFLSVALGQAFSTALAGRCSARPARLEELWPLTITLPAVDCDAGPDFIRDMFIPLGYEVAVAPLPLDTQFPEWGASTLHAVTLAGRQTVRNCLSHLYVLLPVLDNRKHYGIGADEVEKLLDNAGPWLPAHPHKDAIARRYLRYKRRFVDDALSRLLEHSADEDPPDTLADAPSAEEDALERPLRLHDQRLEAAADALKQGGGRRVLDLGCGEDQLLRLLRAERQWTEIVGMDVSPAALSVAERRLHLDKGTDTRLRVVQGSLLYRDDRLVGFDAAALIEVIEHIEPGRLEFLARAVFGDARPRRVVVTTPNADYNSHRPALPAGKMRHRDHRFEWTRAEFAAWAEAVCARFGYRVALSGIGDPDGDKGQPSQMAVFDRLHA